MTFDLQRCLEKDDGKCIIVYPSENRPATVIHTEYRRSEEDDECYLVVLAHFDTYDSVLFISRNGKHDSHCYLKNLSRKIEVEVTLLRDGRNFFPLCGIGRQFHKPENVVASKTVEFELPEEDK